MLEERRDGKELENRLREGLTSPNNGLVLSLEKHSIDDVRKLLYNKGLANIIEMKPVRLRAFPDSRGLLLVRIKESVCHKKCMDKCGSRETPCYGECLYECMESLKELIKEKLGV